MNIISRIIKWVVHKKVCVFLLLIVILATFLRLYKLDQVPPSLNWDEVDAGYNAYTIANWGRDEWGKFLPLVFTSFRDDKHPVHIYFTAPFVKILGLSDYTIRFPSAIIGVSSVLLIFCLSKLLFKNETAALFSALFLAISPYHLQFSRGLWESNFALSFFLFGLLMFFLAIEREGWLLNISVFSFGISLFSYHSSKVIVPAIAFILVFLYFKQLKKLSWNFLSAAIIFSVFLGLLVMQPRLVGLSRIEQTQYSKADINKTSLFEKTGNSTLGIIEIVSKEYLTHFSYQYLFISGDQNPRNSIKTFGEFYKIDVLFLFVGIIYLLKLKSKITLIIFAWLFLSPLPASLVSGAPNANRAIFMLGSINLITGFGASKIVNWFKAKVKIATIAVILILLAMLTYSYLGYYYNIYPKKEATDWQYGMKQVVEYVKNNQQYSQVYVTDIRSQPYIFFLLYLKIPLPDYLSTVIYNRSESIKYSTVFNFGKFYFGNWDPIESQPQDGVLYVITPSQYDGLKHRQSFDIKKIIYYPDGGTDFYMVSKKS